MPDLTWAIYPRNYTTPKPTVAAKIRKLISARKRRSMSQVRLKDIDQKSLDELRLLAQMGARSKVPARAKSAVYRLRSAAIRHYVLKRAQGRCEGCRQPAPFTTDGGAPYLEPHHTTQLSDGGPDDPVLVIALCPNCHRRAHHSADATQFNSSLKRKLIRIERNQ